MRQNKFQYNPHVSHLQGLISPARLGEDGRPEAVEHVLQLIEDRGRGEGEVSDEEE